jgi:hypothetical protein
MSPDSMPGHDPFDPGAQQPVPLSLHPPSSLLAAIPHFLGYHPTPHPARQPYPHPSMDPSPALILLFFDGAHIRGVIDAPSHELRDAEQFWTRVRVTCTHLGTDQVALIAYADLDLEPHLVDCLTAAPLPVPLATRVHDGRMWVLSCPDPGCCPPGARIEPDPDLTTRLVLLTGAAVLPDRDALADCLAPAPGDVLDRVAAHLAVLPPRPRTPAVAFEAVDQARRARVDGPVPLSEYEAAYLLHALTDVRVRTACLAWTGQQDAWWLWLDLVRLAPPRYVPIVSALIAFSAFCRGEGPMAVTAARHPEAAERPHPLARIVLWAHDVAVPAGEFADAARQIAELARTELHHPGH